MVFLRDIDDLVSGKYIPCPEEAFIRREASVVHKDILRGDTFLDGLQFHGLDLVVVLLAIVAAHEQLWRCVRLVQFNSSTKPISQHITGATTVVDITAQP